MKTAESTLFVCNLHVSTCGRIYYFQEKKLVFYNGLGVMVFNATFNNISVISWRSVLLVEETRVPGENHQLAAI